MARRESDTGIGGAGGRFPETRWSAIEALRSAEEAERTPAFEVLVTLYWKPVYKYLRIRWHKTNEDAKDLTQAFFARVFEKNFFRGFDPSRSRFRTFLRTCLDGFTANEAKAARALKRGGDVPHVSLDFHLAEAELQRTTPSPEECFEKEWIRGIFTTALEELRRHCEESDRETHFRLFEKYDVERDPESKISYAELAAEFGLPVTTVTNHLAYARREFRRLVLQTLRRITGSEQEFRAEARRMLGWTVE